MQPAILPANSRDIRLLPVLPVDALRSDEFVPLKLEWESLDDQPLLEVKAQAERTDGARCGFGLFGRPLRVPEPTGYLIQLVMERATLGALLVSRQNNVGYLHRWRLTRQRKHLVHRDPGSIAASRKLALPIVSSMLRSEFSTLASIAARLFFRSAMS